MSSNGSLAEESSIEESLAEQSLDEESLNKKSPCPICGDLDRWTLKVDHVKLQKSAAAKDCVGCMLLFEALNQFDVDFSSLVYSDDIMSKDWGGRSIILSGEGYPRVSVGDDLDIEIYASAGEFDPFPQSCHATGTQLMSQQRRRRTPAGPRASHRGPRLDRI